MDCAARLYRAVSFSTLLGVDVVSYLMLTVSSDTKSAREFTTWRLNSGNATGRVWRGSAASLSPLTALGCLSLPPVSSLPLASARCSRNWKTGANGTRRVPLVQLGTGKPAPPIKVGGAGIGARDVRRRLARVPRCLHELGPYWRRLRRSEAGRHLHPPQTAAGSHPRPRQGRSWCSSAQADT